MVSIVLFRAGRLHVVLAILAVHFSSGLGQSVQSDAECAYLDHLAVKIDVPINSALLPSVNSNCLASWNKLLRGGPKNYSIASLCIRECESLHDLNVRCKGKTEADFYFGLLCGKYDGAYCADLYGTATFATLLNTTASYCATGKGPSCDSDCKQAALSLLEFSGCCSSLFSNETYAACGLVQPDYCTPTYASSTFLAQQISGGRAVTASLAVVVAFAALFGVLSI